MENKKECKKITDWLSILREFEKKCEDYYEIPENISSQLLNGVKDLKGSRSLFKGLSTFDKGRMGDLLAELHYINLFRNCIWTVEIIPASSHKSRPDLKVISDTFAALIETKHIRFRNPGPSKIKNIIELDFLVPYGDFERDEKIIRDRSFEAVDQIYHYSSRNPKDIPIIALWSSDGDIEELEVKFALERIIKQIKEEKPDFPNGLLVFCNGWLYRGIHFLPYPIHISGAFNPIINEIAYRISSIR